MFGAPRRDGAPLCQSDGVIASSWSIGSRFEMNLSFEPRHPDAGRGGRSITRSVLVLFSCPCHWAMLADRHAALRILGRMPPGVLLPAVARRPLPACIGIRVGLLEQVRHETVLSDDHSRAVRLRPRPGGDRPHGPDCRARTGTIGTRVLVGPTRRRPGLSGLSPSASGCSTSRPAAAMAPTREKAPRRAALSLQIAHWPA